MYRGMTSSEEDKSSADLKVLKGKDCYGDLAIAARCDKDGKPRIVAEAHLDLDGQTAYANVRGQDIDYCFDMRNPNTLKIDPDIKTASDLAKIAIRTATDIESFRQQHQALEDLRTRR